MEPPAIDPRTSLGAVRLRAGDIDRLGDFYFRVLGLRELDRADDSVALGATDRAPLVELLHRPSAPPRPRGTTGLLHLALLVPGRAQLAAAIRRVGDAGWRLTGASDHLVSEAVYLRDPEGNGIEVYRDRPRGEWRWDDGSVRMATLPLDLDSVMAELPDGGPSDIDPATILGHVHLNVADLRVTEDFYAGALGFDVVTRAYPGALFMSAGGYHHHIGSNTWEGAGAPPPEPGSLGLDSFEVRLPDAAALAATLARAAAAGAEVLGEPGGAAVTDPSGNRVLLRAG